MSGNRCEHTSRPCRIPHFSICLNVAITSSDIDMSISTLALPYKLELGLIFDRKQSGGGLTYQ
eukprot:scaffold665291_cov57-Prasinocladus_malaysianus.AAC.1